MEKRETFWTSLDHLLQALPRRNLLSLLGDVNCTLPAVPRLVGLDAFLTSDGRKCGPQHSDRHRFVTILKDHDLVALNTWSEQHGPTYRGHFGRHSRIDYILTRGADQEEIKTFPTKGLHFGVDFQDPILGPSFWTPFWGPLSGSHFRSLK